MRNILLFFALACGVLPPAISQNSSSPNVTPTLTHATVFLNRAELTATAKTTIQPGDQRISIENIPLTIDPNSIQVKGTGNAVITGVRFVRDYLRNAPRPANIIRLDDTLRTVQDDIAAAELSYSVLEEEKKLILVNKQVSGSTTGVKVAELKELANFYRERLTDIGTKLIKIKDQLTALKLQETNLKNQLSVWQNQRNQPTGGIEVSVSASARTPFKS